MGKMLYKYEEGEPGCSETLQLRDSSDDDDAGVIYIRETGDAVAGFCSIYLPPDERKKLAAALDPDRTPEESVERLEKIVRGFAELNPVYDIHEGPLSDIYPLLAALDAHRKGKDISTETIWTPIHDWSDSDQPRIVAVIASGEHPRCDAIQALHTLDYDFNDTLDGSPETDWNICHTELERWTRPTPAGECKGEPMTVFVETQFGEMHTALIDKEYKSDMWIRLADRAVW